MASEQSVCRAGIVKEKVVSAVMVLCINKVRSKHGRERTIELPTLQDKSFTYRQLT